VDFERFTERARDVIASSQTILERYKHSQLDVEHILLALIEQRDGLTQRILERAGANVDAIRASVERSLAKTPGVTYYGGQQAQITITPPRQARA
jgi:ATP-dependent Clp protease ATP-binding subunit ClpA